MKLLFSLLKRRDFWRRLLLERGTEPLHLNMASLVVAVVGTTRAKILFDVLLRQQHAYGLLAAADHARARGLQSVTVVELGVGGGAGILNLCELAARITKVTQVRFEIVGFDTGGGMPKPLDHRDHPELYQQGWFPMDVERVQQLLPDNGRVILGDVCTTIPEFTGQLSPAAPLGFVTLDVDYYSSAMHALQLLTGPAENYLPVLPMYVDDISLYSHNPACGELLAIAEFNQKNPLRHIAPDVFLPQSRVFKRAEWLLHMYNVHVFDHPERTSLERGERVFVAANPYLS